MVQLVKRTRSPSFLTLVFLRHFQLLKTYAVSTLLQGGRQLFQLRASFIQHTVQTCQDSMLNLHSAAVRAAEKCDMVSYPTDAFTSMMLTWNQSGK